jgi:hypothetical protein
MFDSMKKEKVSPAKLSEKLIECPEFLDTIS